jgi:hypothetical protein
MPNADEILGPPVLVWRDDPLFNQGHIAAELALNALNGLLAQSCSLDDVEHAIERLEAFLAAAKAEAEQRANV